MRFVTDTDPPQTGKALEKSCHQGWPAANSEVSQVLQPFSSGRDFSSARLYPSNRPEILGVGVASGLQTGSNVSGVEAVPPSDSVSLFRLGAPPEIVIRQTATIYLVITLLCPKQFFLKNVLIHFNPPNTTMGEASIILLF